MSIVTSFDDSLHTAAVFGGVMERLFLLLLLFAAAAADDDDDDDGDGDDDDDDSDDGGDCVVRIQFGTSSPIVGGNGGITAVPSGLVGVTMVADGTGDDANVPLGTDVDGKVEV